MALAKHHEEIQERMYENLRTGRFARIEEAIPKQGNRKELSVILDEIVENFPTVFPDQAAKGAFKVHGPVWISFITRELEMGKEFDKSVARIVDKAESLRRQQQELRSQLSTVAGSPIDSIRFYDLDDEQKRCIDRKPGCLLVKGLAGSGKTLVLMQHAIKLATANRTERILVVSPSESLATEHRRILSVLVGNIANIECRCLGRLIENHIVKVDSSYAGKRPSWTEAKPNLAKDGNRELWLQFLTGHRPPECVAHLSSDFLLEELSYFCGLAPQAAGVNYLKVERRHRKTRLNLEQRQAVLAISARWGEFLAARNFYEPDAMLARFLGERTTPDAVYTHLLVDEYQELSSAQACFLLGLLKQPPIRGNSCVIFYGDIAQRSSSATLELRDVNVYAREILGASQKTLSFIGRSVNLSGRHRSTHGIRRVLGEFRLANASSLASVEDQGAGFEPNEFGELLLEPLASSTQIREVKSIRRHREDVLANYVFKEVVEQILASTSASVCVIAVDQTDVDRLIDHIGFSVNYLAGSQGVNYFVESAQRFASPNRQSRLHVMSLEQVKGLEYDVVLLWDFSEAKFPRTHRRGDGDGDSDSDIRALSMGLSRARKMVIVTAVGELCPVLRRHVAEHMET